MGIGFSRSAGGKGTSENVGKHGWEEPTKEIRQFLNDPEIEESAKAIAQAAGEAARNAAYEKAYTLSKQKVELAKLKLENNLSEVEAQKAQLELKLFDQAQYIEECEKKINYLESQRKMVEMREKELEEKEKQFNKEKEVLKEEKREILGIGAPAYQARKMYGDTVPGDITHTDVASKFSEFFKNYIRKLPKNNPNVPTDDVKKLITPLFQEAFTMSCQYAMKIIQEQALTLFNDPSEMTEKQKSSHRMKEQQLDTSRAYSLLLYHADVKGRKESIIEELKAEMKSHLCDIAAKEGIELPDELIAAAATITWEIVTLIPPAISCTPRKFDKHYNEQRNALWKVKKGPYELVYTRPVLFFGSDGHVGVAGQVGNKPCDPHSAINFMEENSDEEDEEDDEQPTSLSQQGNQNPSQPPQQPEQPLCQQEDQDPQKPPQGNQSSQQHPLTNQGSDQSPQRDQDLQQPLQEDQYTQQPLQGDQFEKCDPCSQEHQQRDQDFQQVPQVNQDLQQLQHEEDDEQLTSLSQQGNQNPNQPPQQPEQPLCQQEDQDPQKPPQGNQISQQHPLTNQGSDQSPQRDQDLQQPLQEDQYTQQPLQGDQFEKCDPCSQEHQQRDQDFQQVPQVNQDLQQLQHGDQNTKQFCQASRDAQQLQQGGQLKDDSHQLEESSSLQQGGQLKDDSRQLEESSSLQQGGQLKDDSHKLEEGNSQGGQLKDNSHKLEEHSSLQQSQQGDHNEQHSQGDHEDQFGESGAANDCIHTTTDKVNSEKKQTMEHNQALDNNKTTNTVPQPIEPPLKSTDKLVGCGDETPECDAFVMVDATTEGSSKLATDNNKDHTLPGKAFHPNQGKQEGSNDFEDGSGNTLGGISAASASEGQQENLDSTQEETFQEKEDKSEEKKEDKPVENEAETYS